VRFT